VRGTSRAIVNADHLNVKPSLAVKTHVIWRMKQRRELQRCYELRFADVPRAEMTPTAYRSIAEKFANFATALVQFHDGLPSPEYGAAPSVWYEAGFAICYRFLFPDPIVEVLWVKLEEPSDSGLNQSTDPAFSSGTPGAGHRARHP